MCEILTTVGEILGTAITTAAGIYSKNSKKSAEEYERNLVIQQAEKARKDAAYERQTGIEDARNQRLQAILNMGEEKANIASANLSTNSQTTLNILDDSKLNGELDALTTLKKSEKRSNDLMFNSENYYSGAALMSFSAHRNNFSNNIAMTGSVNNSATNIFSKYAK